MKAKPAKDPSARRQRTRAPAGAATPEALRCAVIAAANAATPNALRRMLATASPRHRNSSPVRPGCRRRDDPIKRPEAIYASGKGAPEQAASFLTAEALEMASRWQVLQPPERGLMLGFLSAARKNSMLALVNFQQHAPPQPAAHFLTKDAWEMAFNWQVLQPSDKEAVLQYLEGVEESEAKRKAPMLARANFQLHTVPGK